MIPPPPRTEDRPELVPDLPPLLPAATPVGLFGAADDGIAGTVRPVPTVAIGGVDVAAGPAADGTWPALMVVDGLSVTWGRDEVLEQPAPGYATVTLFDPSAVWAAGADLVGKAVTVRWTWAATTRVIFRGRVAGVEVRRKDVQRPDGQLVAGALVTLSCTSLLTDLGNRTPPQLTWPAESVAARRTRLAALATGVLSSVATRPYYDTPDVAPAQVDSTNVLAELETLYNTTGADRMAWDPDTQALGYMRRRSWFAALGLAQLWRDPLGTGRIGVFIRTLSIAQQTGGQTSRPMYVDARAVEYDDAVSKDMGSRLTRAEVGYFELDAADEARTITKLIPGADEAVVGQRVVTMDTVHRWGAWADAVAVELADFARQEGSGWRTAPLRWDTRRTNGFETLEQADVLLRGVELYSMYFLSGSWLPQLGIMPIFGVIGGTIAYRRGDWVVEWSNGPVSTDNPQPPEITWDHVDNGAPEYTVVWDEDDNDAGMHSSVTWEDLQYVSLGLAVQQLPTDGA